MFNNKNIPPVVKSVSFFSFFVNMSSVIIFSYFSIYLKNVLDIDFSSLGLINGTLDATSYIMKLFSGYISDFIGSRKILILIGSILLFISKPLQSMCTSVIPLFLARATETLAHGLQGTPRNAIICDWASKDSINLCFGYRYCIGSIGSIVGALLASFLYYYFRDFQKVFWFSCIPSITAVFIVIFFIKDNKSDIITPFSFTPPPILNNSKNNSNKKQVSKNKKRYNNLKIKDIKYLNKKYWIFLSIACLYNFASISDAMALVYVTNIWKMDMWLSPLFLIAINIGSSISSYLVGNIANKLKKIEIIFIIGIIIFIIACLLLMFCEKSIVITIIALNCLGIYAGINHSTFQAGISCLIPKNLKGTGLGIYNLACALSVLFGSTIAGIIAEYSSHGQVQSIYISAILANIALVFIIIYTVLKYRQCK